MSFLPAAARRTRAAVPALSGRNVVVIALLLVLVGMSYTLWLRNSALVAVSDVEVEGVTGAEEEVVGALTLAGEKMTTLNVDEGALMEAVAAYPTVESVSADAHFPRGMTITVVERPPVATVGGGDGVAVAGDGTVLAGVETTDLDLPKLKTKEAPSSGLLEGEALAQAQVLGGAPEPLRPTLEKSQITREWGVVVELTGGIELRFGEPHGVSRKWSAAAAILADPNLETLSYIDLRVADRPAVGGAPVDVADALEAEAAVAAPVDPAAVAPPATDPAAVPAEPEAPAVTPETASQAAPAPDAATGVAGGAAAPAPAP